MTARRITTAGVPSGSGRLRRFVTHAEENVPTQPAPSRQNPRLSPPHAHPGRAGRAGAAALPGPPPSDRQARSSSVTSHLPADARLRRTAEYQSVYRLGRRLRPARFQIVAARLPGRAADAPAQFGITVPRRLGGAVVRNRIRRRTRALLARLLPQAPRGWAIVLHPRAEVARAPFAGLLEELSQSLRHLAASDPDMRATHDAAPTRRP